MKRRWRISGLVLLGLFAIIASGLSLSGPREPDYQGRRLTSWLEDLRSGSAVTRTNGIVALRHMGTNAVPLLLRMLHSKDSKLKVKWINLIARQHWYKINFRFDFDRRDDVLRGLGALGPDAKAAIPEIAKLLNNGLDEQTAAYTLYQIGPDAIPALNSALSSPNESVRRNAAAFLGLQKGKADDVVPSLIRTLQDPDDGVRLSAVRALSRFPDRANVIVPALIPCLDDLDDTVRRMVAGALTKFGTNANPAIPKLLKMVESSDSNESEAAARALLKLDRDRTLAVFIQNLESPNVEVRRKTAWALENWKTEATPAVPALVKCLKDQDNKVKENAAVALREIGADPGLVVPALMENLKDPDLKVRSITAIALCNFGERAKPAVPMIIKLIEENRNNQLIAGGLYNALARIDPEAADKLSSQ